jgi:lipopolysaccharide/colanic/teichoic acid biosynthesis glycosyltransferase
MTAIPSNQIDLTERAVAAHLKAALECTNTIILPVSFPLKTIVDRVLAAILLVPCLPVIGFLIGLVRLTSRGPGIYRQIRVGRHGRPFMMYKIRTMRHDAELVSGAVWAKDVDPRVTKVGRMIRRLHLDELPQLFNVLKGEMSLVGPRPERPEFVHVLMRKIPDYGQRLAVRPGITGLAQLNLPPDSDLQSVRRKLVLDIQYIRQASAWLDARLILCTAARVFKLPVVGFFGLHRSVTLPPLPATPDVAPSLDRETPSAAQAGDKLGAMAHEFAKCPAPGGNGDQGDDHKARHALLRSKPK